VDLLEGRHNNFFVKWWKRYRRGKFKVV